MGSSVSGSEDGGFKILSGSASNGGIGATSPSPSPDVNVWGGASESKRSARADSW